MGTYNRVAKAKDVASGCGMAVAVGDKQIALFNVDGSIHAILQGLSRVRLTGLVQEESPVLVKIEALDEAGEEGE